ncbi:hypothetical protein ABZ832_20880 [Streptantibioticus parmotrematis]|uniref:hypothetical protein n=1 Tax=Streptantibioticus parmotrematis TaxID=2873249 RepID=UPI0033D9E2F3
MEADRWPALPHLAGVVGAGLVMVIAWLLIGPTWDSLVSAADIGGTPGSYTASRCRTVQLGAGEGTVDARQCVGTFHSRDGRTVRTDVALPDTRAQVGVPTRMVDTHGRLSLPSHGSVFWQTLKLLFVGVPAAGLLTALALAGEHDAEDRPGRLWSLWALLCAGACRALAVVAGAGFLLGLPAAIAMAIAL